MDFINPAAFWGFLAVSAPIIIHLITRRRALRKPFAAMRFVLLSYQNVRRRLRLKRILILLARTLAIAMLAMIILRPTVQSKSMSAMGSGSRTIVIIVDNTMSMTRGKSPDRPFDKAMKIAAESVESLGPGQEAAILAVDSDMMKKPEGAMLRADPKPLIESLESVKVSYMNRPAWPAISAAAEIAKGGRYPTRQVLLITDLQKTEWEGSGNMPEGVELLVLDVGAANDYSNSAVTDMILRPSAGEARYDADVGLASFSASEQTGKEIVVKVGEEDRARGFVDLPAQGSARKELSFSSTGQGMLLGSVRLTPDALEADNERYFTARAGGMINAIVVDGDPKPERYGAESYYIMNALNPRLETRSRVEPKLMTVEEFANASLEGFDLVILANVGALPGKTVQSMREFVKNGGSLIFTLGDQIDPDGFQSSFGDLLPAPLFVLKEPTDPEGVRLDPFKDDHAATAIFKTPGGGDLTMARFERYYMVDSAAHEFNVALSLSDGSPALIEKAYGMGRVAMFTSTIDRDWNDLCIYPTYLPLLQQVALYLTGGLADPEGAGHIAGSTAKVTCGGDAVSAAAILPDGESREMALTPGEKSGELFLDAGPGFYKVYCSKKGDISSVDNRRPDKVVAANVDTRESDLTRYSADELAALLKKSGGKSAVGDNLGALATSEGFSESRKEIWTTMFALMVGLMLFEGILTRKG